MTLRDALLDAYAWSVVHATVILIAAVAVPAAGALAAEIGKGGRTDADGKVIASIVVGIGALSMVLAMVALHFAHSNFESGLLDADWRLALAPIACLGCSLVAVRWVFPLSELAGARSVGYLVVVFGGCWLLIKFFSMFEGWHITIWGSLFQLVLVLAAACYGLWRMFKRAMDPDGARSRKANHRAA
jgi:hypothetical protein